MATRERNERLFPEWEDLPDGGRRYLRIVVGQVSGYACYVKIVDAQDVTVTITQEIFDNTGRLIARHQKYPVDTGHEAVEEE